MLNPILRSVTYTDSMLNYNKLSEEEKNRIVENIGESDIFFDSAEDSLDWMLRVQSKINLNMKEE